MPDGATPERLIDVAQSWIGTPYQHQASVKQVGCDCLGLVRGIWRELYACEPEAVPAYSPDWAEAGRRETLAEAAARHMTPVPLEEDMRAGELLIFRWRAHVPAKHLAITTAPDLMVHAQQGAMVCQVPITNWWARHIAYRFSFPGIAE